MELCGDIILSEPFVKCNTISPEKTPHNIILIILHFAFCILHSAFGGRIDSIMKQKEETKWNVHIGFGWRCLGRFC